MDGGTFDVSLLTIFEMKVRANDTHFGGEDFEIRIVGPLHARFPSQKNHVKELTENHRDVRRLVGQCERAKRTLSSPTQATTEIDLFPATVISSFRCSKLGPRS